MRIRNARQSGIAPDTARVHKHHVFTCDHGGHIYRANLGGPGGEYRHFEVPFCEHEIRGSKRPYSALLVSSNTKWMYAATVEMAIVGILEGPGMNLVYSRSHFANSQCEAVNGCIPLF